MDGQSELHQLAFSGARTLEEGLRSPREQTVRSAFRHWFEEYASTSLDRILSSPDHGMSTHYRVGYFGVYFRAALTDAATQEAASELRALIALFAEPEPEAEAEAEPELLTGSGVEPGRGAGAHRGPVPGSPARPGPSAGAAETAVRPAAPAPAAPGAGPAVAARRPSGDEIGFTGGTYFAPVVGVQNNTVHPVAPPGAYGLPDPDGWPTVDEADPIALGVRPARRLPDLPRLPPYVSRDVDHALTRWCDEDGLLVITGGPMSGRSRTAWETLRRHAPAGARVYAPAPGTDLRALPGLLRDRTGDHVLWLDDLDAHVGEHGLEPALLAQLTKLGVPVLGTMSDHAYDDHLSADGPAHRLLVSARTERLATGWSAAERQRLAGVAYDPRLVEAARRHGGTGLTRYLAVAPLLSAMWRRSRTSRSPNPGRHLLIRAAVDLVRCGVTGDIPQEVLEEAFRSYGRRHSGRFHDGEAFAEALDWAAECRHEVTGMLVRGADRRVGGSERTWRPHGSLVADVTQDAQAPDVPDEVWRCVLKSAAYDPAVREAVRGAARGVFAPKAQAGDAEAMYMLSLVEEGGPGELDWLRKAVDAGKAELSGQVGERLLGRGEPEEALPYLRAAAGLGPGGPGTRLVGEAHLALAEQWLRRAAQEKDPRAARRLGDLEFGRGEVLEALEHYAWAHRWGHAAVARGLAMYTMLMGERELAEAFLSRAKDAGDRAAAGLLELGREEIADAAEKHFSDEVSRAMAMTHRGVAQEKKGDPERAREHYEQGYRGGDAYGAYRLAELLRAQGSPEADLWYRRAAELGHPGARAVVAEGPATVEE
ncbi:tetratricopeptide repeat protein [Streptomyces hilarionis]|uniref:tetratricopeptide repeat protein n=1 Tax=Streptomyces hilarionis TaxID=2839954 RepID=UPI002119F06D|nr:hypothetical protein [Streptomyces hilarionis]MCQ9134037.1 hypothetical protein [Streptomyces hilarionis]